MANVIPMAGLGSRFSDAGYKTPKPLIEVAGEPMIVQVVRSLPKSDRWIFIVRVEHIKEFAIDKIIKREVPNAEIIALDHTTEGQACTCLLGVERLAPDEEVLIAACDNMSVIDEKKYQTLTRDPKIDAVVWTFTQREKMREAPQSMGWIVHEPGQITIRDMIVKKPVSADPFYDHAVVATFYFKRARDYIAATKLMMTENYRVNNEFYVDSLPIFLNKLGKRSVFFDVTQYFCWGTPAELDEYHAQHANKHRGKL